MNERAFSPSLAPFAEQRKFGAGMSQTWHVSAKAKPLEWSVDHVIARFYPGVNGAQLIHRRLFNSERNGLMR